MSISSLARKTIYVTGLPRAGSTLLCQILGEHPEVYSTGHTSPLGNTLTALRAQLSDNEFLLAQLDVDDELVQNRLSSAFRGFINGWFEETDKLWVVDKSRIWLQQIETVALLDPDFRMLVCIREPGQILGSIESQHQRTLMLDFPDHLAGMTRYARADRLFAKDGVIGGPMAAVENIKDIPEQLQQRLFYVVFEDLVQRPVELMQEIYAWLGLPQHRFDPGNLTVRPHESDSYYRLKYRHATSRQITQPEQHVLSPRIEEEIRKNFRWFYEAFYPGLVESGSGA